MNRFVTLKKDGVIKSVNILEEMMFDVENESIQGTFWFVYLIFHASVIYGILEILDTIFLPVRLNIFNFLVGIS